MPLHGRRTARARINLITRGDSPWYEIEIIEGRQNQIRLMFQYFGLLVEKLRRVRIGNIELGKLQPTEWRTLEPKELNTMRGLLNPQRYPAASKAAAKPAKPAAKSASKAAAKSVGRKKR